jgi:hypothetical protein
MTTQQPPESAIGPDAAEVEGAVAKAQNGGRKNGAFDGR